MKLKLNLLNILSCCLVAFVLSFGLQLIIHPDYNIYIILLVAGTPSLMRLIGLPIVEIVKEDND